MLMVVGTLLGRGVDARWLIAPGLLVMAAGNYWMALMNLQISPWQVIWPRVVLIVGLSLIFAPINVAAFLYIPKHLRGAAVGLLALLRNEGGSFGTSMAQTIEQRREQFHLSRLGDFLGPLNPHASEFLNGAQAFFLQQTGDPAASQHGRASTGQPAPAAGRVAGLLRRLLASRRSGCRVGAPGPFMKRSVAEKGAHVGAE